MKKDSKSVNSKGNLSVKSLIIMGGALFSMHFGASCMLYPVQWGRDSGSDVFIAYIAIVLTALLLPLLAYIALSKGGGTFWELALRLSPKFGKIFCGLTALILGPLYIIPRMSAAAWDALMQVTGLQISSALPLILFNCVYYALTYWFIAGRSNIMDKVGKILFPVLLLIVVGVIGKGLMTPIATEWVPKNYDQPAWAYGFLQGYQTGDLPAALMFGLVMLQSIRAAGVEEKRVNKNMVYLGFVGMGMLAVTHLGHMVVGANVGDTIDLTLSALYAEVVLELWGRGGAILFNIALMFAALTTAVGCAGSAAEFFEVALENRYSYKKLAAIVCVVSTLIGSIGLSNIVTFVGPLLNCCYPSAIVMVLYYVLCKNQTGGRLMNGARFAMIAAFIIGLLDVFNSYNTLLHINSEAFSKLYQAIPLTSVQLTWIPAGIIFFLIGMAAYWEKKTAE